MRHFFSISVLPIILLSGLNPAVADQAAVDLAAATQQQMQQQEQLQQQLMWAQQQQQQQLQQQLMWAQQQQQQQMQLSNGVSGMQPYCNYYGTCPKMGIAPAGPDLFYLLTAHPQEAAPATLEGSPEAADAEFPRRHYSKKKRTARRSQTASGSYRSTRYR